MTNYQKFEEQLDFLKGNICRICVTDDLEELMKLKELAKKGIDNMYQLRREKLFGLDEEV